MNLMKLYSYYRNILIGIPIGITILDSVGKFIDLIYFINKDNNKYLYFD